MPVHIYYNESLTMILPFWNFYIFIPETPKMNHSKCIINKTPGESLFNERMKFEMGNKIT